MDGIFQGPRKSGSRSTETSSTVENTHSTSAEQSRTDRHHLPWWLLSVAIAAIAIFAGTEALLHAGLPGLAHWQVYLVEAALMAALMTIAAYRVLVAQQAQAARVEQEVHRRRGAEIQLENLFSLSQDLLCVGGSGPYFERTNPAFGSVLGYTHEELTACSYLDLVHPDDRQATSDALAQLNRGEPVVDLVNRYRHKHGGYRWLQWRAIATPDGRTTVGVARDITDLREQQIALTQSEERYRLLFQNMGNGVAVYDVIGDAEDFVFKDMNHAGERMGGFTRERVVGRSVREVFPGVEDFGLFEVFRRVSRSGVPEHVPAGLYSDDRVSVWVENFVFRLPSGEVVAVYNDVTGHKLTEQRLRESEIRFRTLFEQAPIGIDLVSPDGRVLRANRALQQLFGYTEAEMLGRHFNDWTHPDDVPASVLLVHRLKRGEADRATIDKRYLRKDGDTFWAHTAVAAVRRDDGEVDYFVAMVEDTTLAQRAQAETRALMEENRYLARRLIRAQEREREQIARELHDEIGQNLTGIRADAQAIIERCVEYDEPQVLASARAIDEVADRLYSSAHQLIQQLRPSLLHDLGLKESLDEMLARWCQRHPHIHCSASIADDLDGVPSRVALTLYRVLQESLTNVSKHADASQLRVELQSLPDDRPDHHSVRLSIVDNGKGFAESGFRGRIGLIGMRERVMTLGGTFTVKSAPQAGVTLIAEIPFQRLATSK